ncbi:MAG TPA: lysylphosphatidylglycerol synthase transmembrane domain-containing protein [Flavisolibacter sp.]|nr:lysylphosphatidylglycerol synthase transmembrane domain-containing protein [Flavisolibacter sp.]
MKRSILTILQYLFFVALGFLFVWLTVKDIKQEEWAHIKSSLRNARSWVVLPVLSMLLLSHYSRAIRWKILMEPLGVKPSTFNTWAAVMIGYLVNAGVPRLGEVVKCSILAKYEKVRVDSLVGTIVIERIVDLVCLIIVFIAAILFQGHIIGDYLAESFGNLFRDETGHTSYKQVAFTGVIIVTIIFTIYFLLKRFGHINIVTKLKNIILGIGQGLNSIRIIKRKGAFLFHTILIWMLYLLSTTAGIYALRETEHLGLPGGLTTLAVGSVGMIITPGGIGAYPLLVAKLMELYGLDPKTIGTALGWLLWTAQTLIVLICGVIFSALFSYYNKKKRTIEIRKKY